MRTPTAKSVAVTSSTTDRLRSTCTSLPTRPPLVITAMPSRNPEDEPLLISTTFSSKLPDGPADDLGDLRRDAVERRELELRLQSRERLARRLVLELRAAQLLELGAQAGVLVLEVAVVEDAVERVGDR